MGTKILELLQTGKEVAWGTAVAATAKLMGYTDFTMRPVTDVHQPEERGRLGPSPLAALVGQAAEGNMTLEATYEDLPFIFDSIFAVATPTGADPYTYAYTAPYTAVPTIRENTFEFGQSGGEYKLAGGVLTGLTITGETKGVWTVAAPVIGKQVSTVTLASLNDRTVELIRFADTVLYIDAWGGTIGTTAITSAFIRFELAVETGRHLKFFDTSVLPGLYGHGKFTGTLKLLLEWNAAVKAYLDSLITPALVQKQIRIKATSGTHMATIDFAGVLAEAPEMFQDREGNEVVELSLNGQYNPTLGNWCKTEVVNGVATLP